MDKRHNISYSRILPVLLFEYLAISLARTLFPNLIVETFQDYSYVAVGLAETVKGLLAFIMCPLIGRISDKIGRKYCVLFTMLGTTLPVCAMIFGSNMYLYTILLGLSGFFAGTFTLTFAYISDCVEKKFRAPAFGLALATFGLSFSIGPILGSYIAREFGNQFVFLVSTILVVLNVFYIILFLPETKINKESFMSLEAIPLSWNIQDALGIFRSDKFMSNIATIVLLYYTAVWALVSTLMLYVTRQLQVSAIELGWLMSGYGIATMVSETILVRMIVPYIGEINSIKLGLLAFSLQCFLISLSTRIELIYVSIGFSMFSNLVYPSISSLVSKVVGENEQGEALGTLNGIKSMTEGVGPLVFGLLMSLFENTSKPGAPYLLAGILTLWSFLHCYELPSNPEIAFAKGKNEKNIECVGLLDSEDEYTLN